MGEGFCPFSNESLRKSYVQYFMQKEDPKERSRAEVSVQESQQVVGRQRLRREV